MIVKQRRKNKQTKVSMSVKLQKKEEEEENTQLRTEINKKKQRVIYKRIPYYSLTKFMKSGKRKKMKLWKKCNI